MKTPKHPNYWDLLTLLRCNGRYRIPSKNCAIYGVMVRFWKWVWEALSGSTTLWGLLTASWQTAVVAVVTAITAYLGVSEGVGLFWIIFGVTGVFAFTVTGLFNAYLFWQRTSVFGHVRVAIFNIKDTALEVRENAIVVLHLIMYVELKNDSDRP